MPPREGARAHCDGPSHEWIACCGCVTRRAHGVARSELQSASLRVPYATSVILFRRQAQNEEGDVIVALRRQNKMDCKAMRAIIRTDALEALLTDVQLAAFGLTPGEKVMAYYGGTRRLWATVRVMAIDHESYALTYSLTHVRTYPQATAHVMAIYHENSSDAIETEAFLKKAGGLLERAKELAQVCCCCGCCGCGGGGGGCGSGACSSRRPTLRDVSQSVIPTAFRLARSQGPHIKLTRDRVEKLLRRYDRDADAVAKHLIAMRELTAVGARCGGPTDEELEKYVEMAELNAPKAVEVRLILPCCISAVSRA